MLRLFIVLPSMIGIVVASHGCSRTQEAFQTIVTCVVDQRGVAELKNVMRTVAQFENLKFIDNSAQQGSDLKAMGADKLLKRDASLAIDLHIEGKGGMGVTAGNLSLPPYQVALGFTEGSDAAKAHRLSVRLVRALSRRWHVETVPQGMGAVPMKSCGG